MHTKLTPASRLGVNADLRVHGGTISPVGSRSKQSNNLNPLNVFKKVVKIAHDKHDHDQHQKDLEQFIDKDLDDKFNKIAAEPVTLSIEQPLQKRFTFKSSGISGLIASHLGEQFADAINNLTDDDQHLLLKELVDKSNVRQEVHETVIKEGQEESDSSSSEYSIRSKEQDKIKHTHK